MIRRRLAGCLFALSCTALCVPAIAGAQRSGIGGFGRGRDIGLKREPGLVVPKQVNMINLLIERRQDLALSDSQFARVISLKRVLDSTNAPVMRKLDSVERLFRKGPPMFSNPSPTRKDSLAEARGVVRQATGIIHDNNAAVRDQAYALLNEQQLVAAQALEAKAEKAIEDDAKKKP